MKDGGFHKERKNLSEAMSGIQLGEKQIALDDLEGILANSIPVVVDPAFAAKVVRILMDVMRRFKSLERESTAPMNA